MNLKGGCVSGCMLALQVEVSLWMKSLLTTMIMAGGQVETRSTAGLLAVLPATLAASLGRRTHSQAYEGKSEQAE